jgi:hypothetical protein
LKPFKEKKKLANKIIQHHMMKVSINVAPLYEYITNSGINGIKSSFLSEGFNLP